MAGQKAQRESRFVLILEQTEAGIVQKGA